MILILFQFADACANNPCASTERCEQTGNQFQCKTADSLTVSTRHMFICRLGISCFDQSTFCSVYQTLIEYCDNRFTLLINNTFLPVLQACARSCGRCTSNQRSNSTRTLLTANDENGILFDEDRATTTMAVGAASSPTSTINVIIGQSMIFSGQEKCLDRRDDCQMQKTYGFCDTFNARYPYDCVKTCHPDCDFQT